MKGPIFEDGPSFETAFKLFHGQDGVVPLSGKSYVYNENPEPNPGLQFNPLAVNAASISLSAFGPEGPFGFNFFSRKWKEHNKNSSKPNNLSQVIHGNLSLLSYHQKCYNLLRNLKILCVFIYLF